MVPPAPRECNQPVRSALHRKQSAHRAAQRSALHRNQLAAHCITNNPRTVQCITAHCIATSSQHIGPRIASRASQRIASHPVHSLAPRECNQPARSALHRKQSTHRQPARHASPAARRTPRTCSSARASQYFALVSFGTFPKFNLDTNCNFCHVFVVQLPQTGKLGLLNFVAASIDYQRSGAVQDPSG
jgi:hypothetical protein